MKTSEVKENAAIFVQLNSPTFACMFLLNSVILEVLFLIIFILSEVIRQWLPLLSQYKKDE